MTVVDASVLIAYGRDDPRALTRLEQDPQEVLRVPAQVWVEYLVGLPPALRAEATGELTRSTHFIPFDRPIADTATRLQGQLLSEGRRLSWPDLQVAATAIHLSETLLTRDGDFADVPGLMVERI